VIEIQARPMSGAAHPEEVTMHWPRVLALLLPAAFACSEGDPALTEGKPALATGGGGCTTLPTLTPPAAMTVPTGTTAQSKFWLFKNNCPSPSAPWDFTVSRTAPVVSAGPGPGTVILDANETFKITVPFTTGAAAGTGTVILKATWDGPPLTIKTATQKIFVQGVPAGIPFGPDALPTNVSPAPFTTTMNFSNRSSIAAQIADARAKHMHIVLVLTGGAHTSNNRGCCLTLSGPAMFDRARWNTTLATFNVPTVQDSVAAGVADGTIIGANVMDEPYNNSTDPDEATWGPAGTMNKARVDSLCQAVQAIFPTLPAGVGHQHNLFDQNGRYQVCQFIIDAYSLRFGSVTAWRDAGTTMAGQEHRQTIFSLNVLNGGCVAGAPRCPMTDQQVKDYGSALVSSGCALTMWRYDATYFANTANKAAFQFLADQAAQQPGKTCRRTL
jgi:hypothetical protein